MKRIIFTLLLLLTIVSVKAQLIKGTVYDNTNNSPLPGATIQWLDTTVGTVTNADGTFEIEKPQGAHMINVSFLGYETKTIHVEKNQISIKLSPNNQVLSDVQVVGRANSQGISKLTPNTVQKITSKELARAACCNLSESFETNASVDVAYADAVSGVKQIQLLGLSGKYSQITMANVPVLRGAETAFGLEYYPGTWINSIQVSKGTAAVKNGYESITGQINFDLKEPHGNERMFFNTYGNQDGKTELNLGYVFDINDKLSTSIMVHGNKNFRELDMNNDGFLDKPMSDMVVAMNQWNYNDGSWESKFGFNYLKDNRKGGQVDFNHNKPANIQDKYGIDIDIQKFNVFAKNGFIFNRPSTSIGTILSYNYFDRNSFYGNNIFNLTQQNFYANFIYASFLLDTRHTYNVGASFVYDDNQAHFSQQANYNGYKESVYGAFAEYNYIPSEKFTLLLGMRYDYSNLYSGFITPRIHAKYNINDIITLRASAGKGYRTPDAISENSKFMASSKQFLFDEKIKQEEAWNYGVSIVNEIPINNRPLNIYLEYYRTDFINQLVVDMEQSSREVHFYNLDGKSYSNVFQIESNYEIIERLKLTAAYRINDVKTTFEKELKEAPFTNKYKGLISLGYSTNLDKWQFDFTAQFNGDQRLPSTKNNSLADVRPDRSEKYTTFIAQITKNYRNWSFYVGGENLNSYTQKNAIIAADNPFGEDFDASQIWAPIYGRMFYAGIKYNLGKE